MTTGLMWDERCMWHNSGLHFGPSSRWVEPIPHPENADGKRRIKNLLDASGCSTHDEGVCRALWRPANGSGMARAKPDELDVDSKHHGWRRGQSGI